MSNKLTDWMVEKVEGIPPQIFCLIIALFFLLFIPVMIVFMTADFYRWFGHYASSPDYLQDAWNWRWVIFHPVNLLFEIWFPLHIYKTAADQTFNKKAAEEYRLGSW